MIDEQIEKLYNWHQSQYKWHRARFLVNRRWHGQQAKWHNQQINKIPGLVTWIVCKTFRKHSATIAASVTANNALFHRLSKK